MRVSLMLLALIIAASPASASELRMPRTRCGTAQQPPCPEPPAPPKLKPFSQQQWLNVPNSGEYWSRDEMDLPNIMDWPRQRVRALLGQPGMSEQQIVPGWEDQNRRLDTYRLSQENYTSLVIEYDAKGVAGKIWRQDGDATPAKGCECIACLASKAAAEMSNIKSLTFDPNLDKTDPKQSKTIRQAEAAFGEGVLQLHTSARAIGGQMWNFYAETWRVADQPHMYFRMTGHQALRMMEEHDVRDAIFDGGYSLIEYFPDCLPGK